MKKSWKLIMIILMLIEQIIGQCCLNFKNNVCIQCPSGMHLHRSNCLYDIPHCVSYINGYDCQQCEAGFEYVVSSNNCIAIENKITTPPTTGFEILPVQYIISPTADQLTQLTKSLAKSNNDGLYLYAGFQTTQKAHNFTRLIFTTNKGFLQAVYVVKDPINDSLLLTTKSIIRRPQQQFINIAVDSEMPDVQKQISELHPQFANSTLIDAFKSYHNTSSTMTAIYRTFMLDGDYGIREITINITRNIIPTILNSSQIDVKNVPQDINYSILKTINTNNFNAYLVFANLTNLTQTIYNNKSAIYNVIYAHPDIKFKNGSTASSKFDFLVQQASAYTSNTDTSPNPNTTESNIVLLKSFLFKKENPNFLFNLISDYPTNKLVKGIVFIQYLNTTKLTQQPVFYAMGQILRRSYFDESNGVIIKAKYGQTPQNLFYQVVFYVQNQPASMYSVFLFSVDKTSRVLTLVSMYNILQSNRQVTLVDSLNRQYVTNTSEPLFLSIMFMLDLGEELYNANSTLVQLEKFNYSSIDQETKQRISGVGYSVKYKYSTLPPAALRQEDNSTRYAYYADTEASISSNASSFIPIYQYVEFRYSIGSGQQIQPTGIVLTPAETFVPLTTANFQAFRFILQDFMASKLFEKIDQNILTPAQKLYYGDIGTNSLLSANKSTVRLELYHLAYNINLTNGDMKLYIFEADLNGGDPIVMNIEHLANAPPKPKPPVIKPPVKNQTIPNATFPFQVSYMERVTNTTIGRLKQFVQQMMGDELDTQRFIDLYRVDPSKYRLAILNKGININNIDQTFQFMYLMSGTVPPADANEVVNNSLSVIVGISRASLQTYIIQSYPIFVNLTSVKMDYLPPDQALALHPNLTNTYEFLTNNSILSPLLSLSATDSSLTITEQNGKSFQFKSNSKLPNISTASLIVPTDNSTKIELQQNTQQVSESVLKQKIKDIFGIDSSNIQDIRVLERSNLLGQIDTYIIDFVTLRNSANSSDGQSIGGLINHEIDQYIFNMPTNANEPNQTIYHRFTFQIYTGLNAYSPDVTSSTVTTDIKNAKGIYNANHSPNLKPKPPIINPQTNPTAIYPTINPQPINPTINPTINPQPINPTINLQPINPTINLQPINPTINPQPINPQPQVPSITQINNNINIKPEPEPQMPNFPQIKPNIDISPQQPTNPQPHLPILPQVKPDNINNSSDNANSIDFGPVQIVILPPINTDANLDTGKIQANQIPLPIPNATNIIYFNTSNKTKPTQPLTPTKPLTITSAKPLTITPAQPTQPLTPAKLLTTTPAQPTKMLTLAMPRFLQQYPPPTKIVTYPNNQKLLNIRNTIFPYDPHESTTSTVSVTESTHLNVTDNEFLTILQNFINFDKKANNTYYTSEQLNYNHSKNYNNFVIIPIQYLYSKSPIPPHETPYFLNIPLDLSDPTRDFLNKNMNNKYKPSPLKQRQIFNYNPENLTFIQIQNNKYGGANIWANIPDNIIEQIYFFDQGFYIYGTTKQFDKYPEVQIYEQIIEEKINKDILDKIDYDQINRGSLVYWRIKQLDNVLIIEFYYEIRSNLLRIQVMIVKKSQNVFQFTLLQFEEIDTYLKELRKRNADFMEEYQNITKQSNEFQEGQKLLQTKYSVYMANNKITDITKQQFLGQNIYTVRYQTPYGKLQANLAYNTKTKSASILSLTHPTSNIPLNLERGCLERSATNPQQGSCEVCAYYFYLHRDGKCYDKMPGCEVQNGNVCIKCRPGYILSKDRTCY